MNTLELKTHQLDAVRANFEQAGMSVSEWARLKGFSASLVYQILAGKRAPKRGQSHQIAVALGLKSGHEGGFDEVEDQFKEMRRNMNS